MIFVKSHHSQVIRNHIMCFEVCLSMSAIYEDENLLETFQSNYVFYIYAKIQSMQKSV
jgi:hypothetical protein